MLVHDLASLEILVEEVNDGKFEFGDVLKELSFDNLNGYMLTSLYSPTVLVSSRWFSGTYSFILNR
jgi:hypothetical protein